MLRIEHLRRDHGQDFRFEIQWEDVVGRIKRVAYVAHRSPFRQEAALLGKQHVVSEVNRETFIHEVLGTDPEAGGQDDPVEWVRRR